MLQFDYVLENCPYCNNKLFAHGINCFICDRHGHLFKQWFRSDLKEFSQETFEIDNFTIINTANISYLTKDLHRGGNIYKKYYVKDSYFPIFSSVEEIQNYLLLL